MTLWRRSGPTPGSAPLWIALAVEIGAEREFALSDGVPRLLAALRHLGVPLTLRLDAAAAAAPWTATVRAAGHEVAAVPPPGWGPGQPLAPTLDQIGGLCGVAPCGWSARLRNAPDITAARAAGLQYDTAGPDQDTPRWSMVAGAPWVTLATTAHWPAADPARILRLIDHLAATATDDQSRALILALDAGTGGRVLAEPDLVRLIERLNGLEHVWFARQDQLARALLPVVAAPPPTDAVPAS